MKKDGFTLVELLVAVTIMALISMPLLNLIRSVIANFDRGTTTLMLNADLHNSLPELTTKLEYATRILDVSLSDNTSGYIRYTSADDSIVTVFQNTPDNKTHFSFSNSYPSENIVAVYTTSGVDSPAEVLVPGSTHFQIQTFAHTSISLASANNTTTINTHAISSIQFRIDVENKDVKDTAEFLVRVSRTPLENNGSITYGTLTHPFNDLDLNGFTYTHLDTALDGAGGASDGVYLKTPVIETVKIKNTGAYYSSIQDAVDAATSGDIIMVGHRTGGYIENVLIDSKSDITILGGYDPQTWIRNRRDFPVVLINRGGYSVDKITAAFYFKNATNCTIDGISIDGNELRYALYIKNSTNIDIQHCTLTDTDRPIIIDSSLVSLSNCSVTANEYAVYVNSTQPVTIERSRFFSLDITNKESTLTFLNASGSVVKNCLILGGYNGVHINNSSSISLINNVIDLPENFGIFVQDGAGTTLQNNAICNGAIGLVISPDDTSKTVEYNYYLNQQARASDPLSLSQESNSYATSTTYPLGTWKTSNSFFNDVRDYIPKTGAVSLVDSGTGSQDYTLFSGSLGTSTNDVGGYGGALGGRIGAGAFLFIASTNTEAVTNTILNGSWPGDTLFFDRGRFTLTTSKTIKKYQDVMGSGMLDTVIYNESSDAIILTDKCSMAYLTVEGNSSYKGCRASTSGSALLHNLIIKDHAIGINPDNMSFKVLFTTLYNNTTGILTSGTSRSTINYSIIADSNLGINESGDYPVTGKYNLFHNTLTLYSGDYSSTGDQSQTASSPLFWDASNSLFQLSPTSNAIDFVSHYDVGAFEFFEFSDVLISPKLSSDLPRNYDEIEITVGGLDSISAPMSQIELAYEMDSQSVTLSPIVIVSQDVTFKHAWSLPPNVISEELKVRVKLTSFTPGRTPYLNELKVIW